LDSATHAYVEDIVTTLADQYQDILLAIILYGSVARHEERPTDDPYPSDVDLLAIFDNDDDPLVSSDLHTALARSLGEVLGRHLDAPREVNEMFASRTLREWNITFIANVAHDGIELYARGLLPISKSLTFQQAEDVINISHDALLALLEEGVIPYSERARGIQINVDDALEYRQQRAAKRLAAILRERKIAQG
jgi:predicted nucleotidyltransferase